MLIILSDEQNKITNAKMMAIKIKWSYGVHGKRNNLIDMMSKCLYINKNKRDDTFTMYHLT